MKGCSSWFFLILTLGVLGALAGIAVHKSGLFAGSNRIGVIEIRGLIDEVQETVKAIKKFRKDKHVKAIVLRIETPGGGIGPSQEVYREVRRTISEKPVVASLGGIAASGGYYIASACSRIVSNPGTITGSIGVIVNFANLQELFAKIGYAPVTIKSGPYKDMGNPGREMTPEERRILQEAIDEGYRQFVRDVATGRNLPEEKVREVADGRLIMGESAQKLGLVDALGNFEDAIDLAAELGQITGEPDIVTAKRERRTVFDLLFGSEATEKLGFLINGSMNFLRYQVPSWP